MPRGFLSSLLQFLWFCDKAVLLAARLYQFSSAHPGLGVAAPLQMLQEIADCSEWSLNLFERGPESFGSHEVLHLASKDLN